MNRLLMRLAAVALMSLMLGTSSPATAQSIPGAADTQIRAELAAIVPDADDLPVGYTFVGETFLTPGAVAPGEIDASTLTNTGFVAMYVSVYENTDSNTRIRSYVSAWTDESTAEAGFGTLEGDSAASNKQLTNADIDVGQEPRQLTTGIYTSSNGSTMGIADVTFRDQNRLIGVAVETTDGSEADAQLATDLAGRIAERAASVQNGDSPTHTDLALPGRALSFDDQGTLVQAGFLGPSDVETIYAVQGSVLSSIKASWVETVAMGNGGTAPLITVGISTFDKPESAAAAVDQSADIFTPLSNQQDVADAKVDGADSVKAYQYSSAATEGDTLDSYRIVFSIDTELMVIDVQGVAEGADAGDLANQLASAQRGCHEGDTCEAPDLSGQ